MKNKRFLVYFSILFILFLSINVSAKNVFNNSCEKTHWLNYIFNTNQNEVMVQNTSSESLAIEYPAVDELEKTILGRIHPEEDIYIRLNRLETSVFGGVTAASLSERVDKLKKVVPESKQYTANKNNYYNNSKFRNRNPAMSYAGSYSKHNDLGSNYVPNYAVELYELEKEFLGQTYSNESMEVRLTRLEKEVFDSSSEDYPVEDRIQRLSAYADARDSNDYYEDQKAMRDYSNMASGAKALSVLFMILQFLL